MRVRFLIPSLLLIWGQCNNNRYCEAQRGTRHGSGLHDPHGQQQQWWSDRDPNIHFPNNQNHYQMQPKPTTIPWEEKDMFGTRILTPGNQNQNYLETDVIDLAKFGHCINHVHAGHPIYFHYSENHKTLPTLHLLSGDEPGCVEIFQEQNCIGHSLQFLNVKQKDLLLRWNGNNDRDKEKLQNFNIEPNSFMKCLPPGNDISSVDLNDLRSKYCQAKLQVTSPQKPALIEVHDKCVDIEKPAAVGKYPYLPPQGLTLYVTKDLEYKDNDVCLELYSEKGCGGQVMRFFIPRENYLWGNSIRVWQYENRTGKLLIDTDVNSVRECSFCFTNPPLSTPKPIPPKSRYPPTSTHKPGIAAPHFQGENPKCNFTNCKPVPTCLNHTNLQDFLNINKSEDDCALFFDDPHCSRRPFIKEKVLNVSVLEQIMGSVHGPEFSKWGVASCKGKEESFVNDCIAPVLSKTLLEQFDIGAFNKLLNPNPNSTNADTFAKYGLTDTIFIGVFGSLAVIMVIIVAIMAYLLWRKKKNLRLLRQRNSTQSRGNTLMISSSGSIGGNHRQLHVHQIDPVDENDYVNDITGLHALIRCFAADRFEIPRDSIKIGNMRDSTASVIGLGEFSIAFKGNLEPGGRTIAVKTMKSGQATARSMKGILKECQVFMMLGKNVGIVEFLGVCTEDVRKGELFVVMEYCENGPLKSFLLQQRSNFVNLVDVNDETIPDTEQMKDEVRQSMTLEPSLKFNTYQLIKWGFEVADAMEFLAVRKIVHVSLSARNVLLDDSYSCKICDFHLAKMPGESHSSGYNTRTITNKLQERLVPWRWFAVESLMDDIFSTQSDVWTYGIFLWEVFTLGNTPYSEYSYGSEFTLCLKHGYRLLKPNFSTIQCYELMLMCWYDGPEKRPNFSKIKEKLKEMLPS